MDAATKPEASGLHSALRYKIIALAGNEYARSATAADAIAGVQPKLVVEPGTEGELAEILRLSSEAGGGDSARRRNEAGVGKFAGSRRFDFINGPNE